MTRQPNSRRRMAFLLTAAILVPAFAAAKPGTRIDYNRDIKPILGENCYTCHGPDAKQRKARLRLDEEKGALKKIRGGRRAIVPGKPEDSALVARITATDEDDLMPPPESGKKLTPAEIAALRQWVAEGAKWSEHWAYVPPRQVTPPEVQTVDRVVNAIDRFILARLQTEKLRPAVEADRVTLIRRLSFDLRGLPPTKEEVAEFVSDKSDNAYEKLVDRFLRSPHYGERMAIFWLDLVRFADTRGYHSDNPRNVAPYRDYVIRSFNRNLPFDQFTVEQLAGDLLPEPTIWQRVATCYNKLNQTTEEGGAQAKEYEAINASDRVRNVSVVWMGATIGCAQCHEHKFDPYPTKDFYSLAAFFADIKENAIMDRDAGIPVPQPEQEGRLKEVETNIATAEKAINSPGSDLKKALDEAQAAWEGKALKTKEPVFGPWSSVGPFTAGAREAHKKVFPPEAAYLSETGITLDASYQDGKLKWKPRPDWADGKVHTLSGDNTATYLYRTIDASAEGIITVSLGSDDTIKLWVNGQSVLDKEVYRGVAPDQDKANVPLRAGTNHLLMKITNGGGGYGFYFKPLAASGTPGNIYKLLKIAAQERTAEQQQEITTYYRSVAPLLQDLRGKLNKHREEKAALEKSFARCVVSVSAAPRIVRILRRGDWMDTSGDVVEPAIPAYFGKLDTGDRRATRLDLAKWLVAPDNPLTARVFVNRVWKLFFGSGISKRLDDLGAMGEVPVHPELLDWLALSFRDSKWNVKHLIKLMVMSSTYRQSSVATAEHRARDPYNRLLARQSSWRLDAELVRDNVLAVSRLLDRKIGGRSVKPYQPAGYWIHLNFPKRRWQADKGGDLYRRGLYTWWQRSFLHPSLLAFDAPNREECTAERPRSNIPQQALVLLNDPSYVEAARAFAERILTSGKTTDDGRLDWAFLEALSRAPTEEEAAVLHGVLTAHRTGYKADPAAAKALVSVGASAPDAKLGVGELAAWTSVARVIFNLHETITRN